MLAFSNDYYGFIFRVTQSVELFCTYDLCDRRPVAFVYSTRNDNPLVFDTFDKAVAANPGATPLLHSDRGYQYTY